MKNLVSFFALFFFISVASASGLKGTYTIDPKGSGTANYTSFRLAAKALKDSGISGAVVFNIADGTYNEAVTIDSIAGSDSLNSIKFQSNSFDSTKVKISWPSDKTHFASLELKRSHWLTFKEITIERTGIDSLEQVVSINANHITITGCVLIGPKLKSGIVGQPNIYINSPKKNMFDSGISIVGNSIKYGFESIHCEWDANLKIDNNICDSSTSCALTLWYIVGTEITGNLISNRYNLDGYAGVFILACSGKIDINNNQILLYNGGDGLEFWQTSSSNYLCANNFIYLAGELPTFGTGIQSFNGSGLHLLYNTVICVNHLGMACEIYQDNKNVIENNIFYNDANYPTCEFYKAINLTSNYNDFFSSSSKLVMWNLKTYNTLSKFQSVSKTDKNSISVNPFFASKEDPPACK